MLLVTRNRGIFVSGSANASRYTERGMMLFYKRKSKLRSVYRKRIGINILQRKTMLSLMKIIGLGFLSAIISILAIYFLGYLLDTYIDPNHYCSSLQNIGPTKGCFNSIPASTWLNEIPTFAVKALLFFIPLPFGLLILSAIIFIVGKFCGTKFTNSSRARNLIARSVPSVQKILIFTSSYYLFFFILCLFINSTLWKYDVIPNYQKSFQDNCPK